VLSPGSLSFSYVPQKISMKLAISGKGGVGKTLLSALLCRAFAESGYSVIAIDADPDANLAATLGFPHPEQITPVSEMKELIEERTGTRPGQVAPYFTLNPKVDDIPDKYAHRHNGVRLMRMGDVKGGGHGCYCPESALLKTLMAHLLVARNEAVILDMEAGIEHLTRGTAGAVDRLVVVVEPGRRSIETAVSIHKLATDLGLKNLAAVGNKVRSESDRQFLGFIPYDQAVVDADLANRSVLTASPQVIAAVQDIFQAVVANKKPTGA
jgi:CO dehydrogenase maturation factor